MRPRRSTQGEALAWLVLLGLPPRGVQLPGWRASVAQWGRVSFLTLALELLETLGDLPAGCLPVAPDQSGYA
jgi:hypothetical protein